MDTHVSEEMDDKEPTQIVFSHPFDSNLVNHLCGVSSSELISDINELNKLCDDNGYYAVTFHDVLIDALYNTVSYHNVMNSTPGRLSLAHSVDYFAAVWDYKEGCLEEWEHVDTEVLEDIASIALRVLNCLVIGFTCTLEEGFKALLFNAVLATRDVFHPSGEEVLVEIINDDTIVFIALVSNDPNEYQEPDEYDAYSDLRSRINEILSPPSEGSIYQRARS